MWLPAGRLESVTGANVLQLLGDFGRRSVQLLRHALLLVRIHAVELLTQIAVDHILQERNEPKIKTFLVWSKTWISFIFLFQRKAHQRSEERFNIFRDRSLLIQGKLMICSEILQSSKLFHNLLHHNHKSYRTSAGFYDKQKCSKPKCELKSNNGKLNSATASQAGSTVN